MSDYHRKALELAREDHWNAAHNIIQEHADKLSCLIHAYLHLIEGDHGNAAYWYRRAGESMPDHTPEEDWHRLHERC